MNSNQQKFIEKWKLHPSRYSYLKVWEIGQIIKDRDERFCVLDIGCGTGATLARIKYLFPQARVIGIEREARAAKLAKLAAEVICADILELGEGTIEAASVDVILTGGVWEHVSNGLQLFEKIRYWLKPKGTVTGSFYNASHPFCQQVPKHLDGYDIGICDPGHCIYYTAEDWVEMVDKSSIVLDEMSFCREAHAREVEVAYQYFWRGH